MRIILYSSMLHLIFFVVILSCCEGFSLEIPKITTTRITSLYSSALPIDNSDSIASDSPSDKNEARILTPKITYRSANAADIPDIVGLLMSSFDDENEEGDSSRSNNSESESSNDSDSDDSNNKAFMWDSIGEDNNQESLPPEQQRQFIETQLRQRMIEVKKEDSLPHSFLVATIPSLSIIVDDNDTSTSVVGFLEMGCLPSPIPISIGGNKNARPELPYIANVAVNPTARRRKIGSTLVRLATKIAAKWVVSGTDTSSFPPFLFLSVERDNHDALMFYERLEFEELNVKKPIQKIYLARVLD
ncbi:hypothetical protein FRACYDRAFT_262494 [Fragilariopsis cylindrus CCMP1102]|uniref:N-acetyltransferase domain-containing protein n=1 Tax=Fragilariopsis cylindrus CCMP1102 TaxID=635003 RepID=A0A1E7F7F8_9STRA|nr:hypothetical protein FRACYDRAFT_262494 [Fragilariopsis cylindrus CCMP1102]|eukprot:OEU14087.1 hypothetical protein FRACYDRAFT_262494 [Fragilariopsis cylindrus CCMP1102]